MTEHKQPLQGKHMANRVRNPNHLIKCEYALALRTGGLWGRTDGDGHFEVEDRYYDAYNDSFRSTGCFDLTDTATFYLGLHSLWRKNGEGGCIIVYPEGWEVSGTYGRRGVSILGSSQFDEKDRINALRLALEETYRLETKIKK